MTQVATDRAGRIAALGYDYSAQPVDVVTSCNLCGNEEFVVVSHRDRYGYRVQAHACVGCGLVFINPRMTSEAYGRFYDGVYRPLVSAFHGRLIDARTIQAEQRDYAIERADFVRPFVAARGLETMLDIGGSTGVVANYFAREFNLRATIVDPAPLEIEQARQFGLETITGLVEEHDFGGRRFDLILVCQTIDHLLDIRGTLDRVRDLLTDGGLLYIDVVDFRAAYLRSWSVEGAIKIDHPYYLTDSTMRTYLRRAGFAVARAHFAADRLHIGYMCRRGTPEYDAIDRAVATVMLNEIRSVQNTARPR